MFRLLYVTIRYHQLPACKNRFCRNEKRPEVIVESLEVEVGVGADTCYTLTWPMAKLFFLGDYIFSRENKVQTFFFRVHWLSEYSY